MISQLQGWAANWTGAGGAGDLQLFTSLPSKSMFFSRALPVSVSKIAQDTLQFGPSEFSAADHSV